MGSSGTVICTLGPLPPGAATTVTVTATAQTPGVATNTATVSSTGPVADAQPANNTASATVNVTTPPAPGAPVADLTLAKTANHYKVTQGKKVTYTLTVANHGPNAAQAVVSEDLDRKLTFVSAAGGTCTTPTVGTSGTIV